MSTATEKPTFKTRCATCRGPIHFGTTPGSGFDTEVWIHGDPDDWQDDPHQAVPELRIVIDATCPGCNFPEIGFAPDPGEFVCSRCEWSGSERPS